MLLAYNEFFIFIVLGIQQWTVLQFYFFFT